MEKQETTVTDVLFRLDTDGECLAVFPYEVSHNGNMMCYAHFGQHSEMAPSYLRKLKKPSQKQVEELRGELTVIGYTIREIYRINGRRYTAAVAERRQQRNK